MQQPDIPRASWRSAGAAIRVTLINMHGDADYFTTHRVVFGLGPDGRDKAQTACRALEELAARVAVKPVTDSEQLAAYVAERLRVEQAFLLMLFDQVVVRNARDEELCAMPVAYLVEAEDEQGRVEHAFFDSPDGPRRYYGLAGVHPSYLKQWA
ncbi:hypothetical protein D3C71_18740 [compost metagenome]